MGRVIGAVLAGVLLTSGIVYAMSMRTTVYISHYSGGIVAVRRGIFTKVCTLAEECELPEEKYKVVYTR